MGEVAEKGCAVCETRNANLGATTKQTPGAGPEHERKRRTTPQRACTPKQQAKHGGKKPWGHSVPGKRTARWPGSALADRQPPPVRADGLARPEARKVLHGPGAGARPAAAAGRPASAPKASRLEPRTSGGSRTQRLTKRVTRGGDFTTGRGHSLGNI